MDDDLIAYAYCYCNSAGELESNTGICSTDEIDEFAARAILYYHPEKTLNLPDDFFKRFEFHYFSTKKEQWLRYEFNLDEMKEVVEDIWVREFQT